MVKYARQQFLASFDDETSPVPEPSDCPALALVGIRDWNEPKDLFDFGNPYIRKITLSQLDLIVYDKEDWFRFRQQIRDLDRLILIDDRKPTSPIMARFARTVRRRYVRALRAAHCPTEFVRVTSDADYAPCLQACKHGA